MPVQYCYDHCQAVVVDPVRCPARGGEDRRCGQCLYLNGKAPVPVNDERYACTCRGFFRIAHKQAARVGNFLYPFAAHIKTADFICRAKTVFQAAQETQRCLAVAFKLAYHVYKMFKGARSCDRAVFGYMPDQEYGDIQRFCTFDN